MKFWDSSAIVPLLLHEEQTEFCTATYKADRELMVWTLSKVEVFSALCRRLRERFIREDSFEQAKQRMDDLFDLAFEVVAVTKVKERSLRLLRVHQLRAADAFQLAAALVATDEDPSKMSIMSFDDRLSEAARKEGFLVNPSA